MALLIQKMKKQEKETIDERVKVPESDKMIRRETELVRGYGAQDPGGPESFAHLRTSLL